MLYRRRLLILVGVLVVIVTVLWIAAPPLELWCPRGEGDSDWEYYFSDEIVLSEGNEQRSEADPALDGLMIEQVSRGIEDVGVSESDDQEINAVLSNSTAGYKTEKDLGQTGIEEEELEVQEPKNDDDDKSENRVWISRTSQAAPSTPSVEQQDAKPELLTTHESFSLPEPAATRPLEEILQSEWVGQLKSFLGTVSSGPVTLVSSDYGYREVLLNWLISATIGVAKPLSNILSLSLDASLYHLLVNKSIPCVHVSPEALLRPSIKLRKHVGFTQVHIMRLTVMRLINHWGFDVANYDTDALILKNPEHLYYTGGLKDRDFIGSYGHFPSALVKKWGVAVCIGVVFIRSTPQTEMYWDMMEKVVPLDNYNDQARLNAALQLMDVQPESDPSATKITTQDWLGRGRDGFTVAVLPISVVCRQSCSKKLKRWYYVWHKGGAQNTNGKKKYASQGGLWFLRPDWEMVSGKTVATGRQWLTEIAVSSHNQQL